MAALSRMRFSVWNIVARTTIQGWKLVHSALLFHDLNEIKNILTSNSNREKIGLKARADLSLTKHTVNHFTNHSVVIHHTRCQPVEPAPSAGSAGRQENGIVSRENRGSKRIHRSGSCSNFSPASQDIRESLFHLMIVQGLLFKSHFYWWTRTKSKKTFTLAVIVCHIS